MPTVLMDLGTADELELSEVSPGLNVSRDSSSLIAWRDRQGRLLVLSLPVRLEWDIAQDEGIWYVEIDAEAGLRIDVTVEPNVEEETLGVLDDAHAADSDAVY